MPRAVEREVESAGEVAGRGEVAELADRGGADARGKDGSGCRTVPSRYRC